VWWGKGSCGWRGSRLIRARAGWPIGPVCISLCMCTAVVLVFGVCSWGSKDCAVVWFGLGLACGVRTWGFGVLVSVMRGCGGRIGWWWGLVIAVLALACGWGWGMGVGCAVVVWGGVGVGVG